MERFKKIYIDDEISQYEVGEFGSLRRIDNKLGYFYLKTNSNGNNYVSVSLRHNKKYYPTRIHRLVAKAFIPNPNNYPQINHIDCNKSNNRADNLEWCTCRHNIRHAFKNGLVGRKQGRESHMYNKGVKVIDNNTGIIYNCVAECARSLGIPRTTISAEILGYRPNKYNISRL